MRRIQYRLLGTATAAPNDYIELGTSSEALGELGHMDMLTRFFVNDAPLGRLARPIGWTARAVEWRLKGHAEEPFWRWVSSWARAMRRPSDYGYDDGRLILPELIERVTVVEARDPHARTRCSTCPAVRAAGGTRREPPHPRGTMRGRGRRPRRMPSPASRGAT